MICVDPSVAAKWILTEERSDLARALLEAAHRADEPIVAPYLLPLEIANILRQRMRGPDRFTRRQALSLLDEFLALPIAFHTPPGLHLRALELADTHGLPAAYDAHYVAVAESLGCDLWSDDRRLLRSLAGAFPFVRPLAVSATA